MNCSDSDLIFGDPKRNCTAKMVEKIVCKLVRSEVTVGSRRCQAGRSLVLSAAISGPIPANDQQVSDGAHQCLPCAE